MSLGATTSAPARACTNAALASTSRVASLSTSISPRGPGFRIPQCPWSVYSSTHTSVMTSSSGTASFIAATACATGPFGSYALDPDASLVFGRPNRSTPPRPSDLARRACSAAADVGSWNTPGIVLIGRGVSSDSWKNSGKTRSDGESVVSRTRVRIAGDRRNLRGRSLGNTGAEHSRFGPGLLILSGLVGKAHFCARGGLRRRFRGCISSALRLNQVRADECPTFKGPRP